MKKIGRRAVLPWRQLHYVAQELVDEPFLRAILNRPPRIPRWLIVGEARPAQIDVGQSIEDFARDQLTYRVKSWWNAIYIGRKRA